MGNNRIPIHTVSLIGMLSQQQHAVRQAIDDLAVDAKAVSPNGYDLLLAAQKKFDEAIDVISKEGPERAAKLDAAMPSLREVISKDVMKGNLTRLKDGELDQKTEPHPNFAGYDHSLEMNRWKDPNAGIEL